MSDGLSTKKVWHLFVIGGVSSCFGEFVTLPIDVVKVRMQLDGAKGLDKQYRSINSTLKRVVHEEGFRALYSGLGPALVRQLFYGGLRIGLYEPIKTVFNNKSKEDFENKVPIYKKFGAAICSGAIGAGICNPIDVVKIRMQSVVYFGGKYKNMVDAFYNISKKEGIRGLYSGWVPTSQRAAVIAAAELATYDEAKYYLVSKNLMGNGPIAHLTASLISGFIATVCCSPLDFIKTRLQGQPVGPDGRGLIYKNSINCAILSVKSEGPLCLWKGMWPHYLRRGPHVIISFFILEQMRSLFDKYL